MYFNLQPRPTQANLTIRTQAVSAEVKDDLHYLADDKYVDTMTCAKCHENEHQLWVGSHHDQAMKVASPQTVLGNFNDKSFTKDGVTTKFLRKGKEYFINAQGPDGEMKDYQVLYTFGFYPLQQYLLQFDNGKLQAHTIAWDSRPAAEGGQKWYDLYPEEKIPHDDPLHWTSPNFNWNFMCADCHSTNLKKNFDPKTNEYHTTWSKINVACQSCHGPGSDHVKWAETYKDNLEKSKDPLKGLSFKLKEPTVGIWETDPKTNKPKRTQKLASNVQVETCARCHSRRTPITKDYVHGKPFLDTHLPEMLRQPIYHSDGQIKDEVYVYGSFIQSKMYHNDVRCSDCHDVHSTKVKFEGNPLCHQCHKPEIYESPKHHHHKPFKEGASCVDCHMPHQNYMIVDPRRDHSIRVPRPDLSLTNNTPNACNNCHQDKSTQWAAEAFTKWYPNIKPEKHAYGHTLKLASENNPQALPLLEKLIQDKSQPAIARATGVSLINNFLSQRSINQVVKSLTDKSEMVRLIAVQQINVLPPAQRFEVAKHLLTDPIKVVRLHAGSALSQTPDHLLDVKTKNQIADAINEYIAMQQTNIDMPFAHINLGIHYTNIGKLDLAKNAYLKAISLDRLQFRAYVNLADTYRKMKDEGKTVETLETAIKYFPDNPLLYQTLGYSYVRQKEIFKALPHFKKSADLNPTDSSFSYVYGIALQSSGQVKEALEVLIKSHKINPKDTRTLQSLIQFSLQLKRPEQALFYGKKLHRLTPQNQNLNALISQLEKSY